MGTTHLSLVPVDFLAEVRDAIAHLYDSAYLVRHPLIELLVAHSAQGSSAAVRSLRTVLLETVEELRPPTGTPEEDPAWRPYLVIWHRFVVGKRLSEVEAELALGRRQVQREQRRGLELLGLKLWEKLAPSGGEAVPTLGTVFEEAARIVRRHRVDVGEQLGRALGSVAALADQLRVDFQVEELPEGLVTLGDEALIRQIAVAVLSLTVRMVPEGMLRVGVGRSEGRVTLAATACSGRGDRLSGTPVTDSILALAAGQDAEVTDELNEHYRSIRVSFPAAPSEYLVAFIEDNEDVVALFQRYLSGHGYTLVGVTESISAVERVSQLSPDVILLDVMMHDLDGWEVLQQLKARPGLRCIPTVVCSVLNEPELATSLGADAYLCKPVRPARLLECLSALLPG